MSRLTWIPPFVILLLIACGPTVTEEPAASSQTQAATSRPPTATIIPEPTATPTATQADATETPHPTVEPAEQIEPHELTAEELQALSEGTRFDWTSGAIDTDQFGNTYIIVTDIPNYHLRSIDGDLMKEEFGLLDINLRDDVSYQFEFINIENFDELPDDAQNRTNMTNTPTDPDLATGSIRRQGDTNIVTVYYSSQWLEYQINDFSKDSFGHEAFIAMAATLYMNLSENLGKSAPVTEVFYELIEKLPMESDIKRYYPTSIDAYWDDQTS
jgi:hypothetical protein